MNAIKNEYEYILTDRFGVVDVMPLNEKDFTIEYNIEEDGKYFYSKQFGGKITFNGVIFQRLKDIEKTIYICTEQQLEVFRDCGNGVKNSIFKGEFKLSDGVWDLDNCTVELGFNKTNPDKCLSSNKNKKINLLQEINTRFSVNTTTPNGVLEYKECSNSSDIPQEAFYWCGTGDPFLQNYQLLSTHVWSVDGVHYRVKNTWVREQVKIGCGNIPPSDWVLIQDNCSVDNTKTYAKKVSLYGCTTTTFVDDTNPDISDITQKCLIMGYSGSATVIDNGMQLKDVLNVFISKLCGEELVIVSDFFQINPENPSLLNYVTGLITQVNNILIFQKSDVKRPSASGNALKAEMTFDKLIEALNLMFNVFYAIDGNILRLEHISYFSRNAGLDLTLPRYERFINGKNKYTYKVEGLPSSEVWQYKETNQSWIADIDYANACVIGQGSGEKKYILDEITADVALCIANPSYDSNIVEDKGIVFIATVEFDGDLYILTENEINPAIEPRLNNTLGFHKLVKNYHFHNRPLKTGTLNGADVVFISTKPLKKGEKLSVPLCCNDDFDPNDTINTPLGVGFVDKAVYNLSTKTIELDLLYNVFENLINNLPPVISGANLTTVKDSPTNFPIVASDSDGVVVRVEVALAPLNGTVEVLSLTQATYTPNAGFFGYDFFHLIAFDNFNEVSDVAPFVVEVQNV